MKLTAQLKKLILQPVHCTGYLSQIYGNYRLEHNEYDNKWYFKKKIMYSISIYNCQFYKNTQLYIY